MFTRIATIIAVGFLLAVVSPIAMAQPPILVLDANEDDDAKDGWTNTGSAGGVVPTGDGRPDYDRDGGPGGTAAYTSTECNHNFSRGTTDWMADPNCWSQVGRLRSSRNRPALRSMLPKAAANTT